MTHFSPLETSPMCPCQRTRNPNSADTHRGFAYVEFEDADDSKEAIDNMDKSEFFGRVIRVSAAKAPKSADERLGSKTAVWEQVYGASFYLPSPDELGLTAANRKGGSLRTPSARTIGWLPSKQKLPVTREGTTRCRGWRVWMLQVLSLSRALGRQGEAHCVRARRTRRGKRRFILGRHPIALAAEPALYIYLLLHRERLQSCSLLRSIARFSAAFSGVRRGLQRRQRGSGA